MSIMQQFQSDPQAFNRHLIAEFRANGGVVSSLPGTGQLLLLTTTGARSGRPHTVPLGFRDDGEHLVIIASANGAPRAPAWFRNLAAHPEVAIEVGTARYTGRATVAEGADRARLVDFLATAMPFFAAHEARAGRQIPIVLLPQPPR